MIATHTILIAGLLTLLTNFSHACSEWGPATKVGALDHNLINEASGLALSQLVEDRMFHINDSGGGPYFFTTDLKGGNTQKIEVDQYRYGDSEALGYGPCGAGEKCLYLAVIGDNSKRRKTVRITLVKDREVFGETVSAYKTLTLKYPDGARDAEGFAVHPNGDMYIISKEDHGSVAKAARIYKLAASEVENDAVAVKTLEFIGELDIPSLVPQVGKYSQLVTGFDISSDGKKILFLTYGFALEMEVDLSELDTNKPILNMSLALLKVLPQQEAIMYSSDGQSFLYTTEHYASYGEAPLYQVDCTVQ